MAAGDAGGGAGAGAPSRRMSRLRAEKLVFLAFRIPTLDRTDSTATPAPLGAAAPNAQSRPRLLSRAASRGCAAAFSPDVYLQQSGVQFFVEDLIKRLQEQRPEQPAAFIAAYFAAVVKGTHVSGRAFEFVNGTMQNRVAFLSLLHKTFAVVDQSLQLTLDDFGELIRCQCRDFPAQILQQSAHHLKESDGGSPARATLRAFLAAFSACFLYNEFLSRALDIYGEMQAARDSRVVSPRSSARSESIANAMAADRVIARLRVVAAQQTHFSIPPMLETEAIVYKSSTFKEFCARFYESPAVAASVSDLQRAFQTLGGGARATTWRAER